MIKKVYISPENSKKAIAVFEEINRKKQESRKKAAVQISAIKDMIKSKQLAQ